LGVEEVIDAEEVSVRGASDRVQGSAADDEDSGVDEEGEGKEGDSQFDDGVLHAGLDGGHGGAVFSWEGRGVVFSRQLEGGIVVVSLIELAEARLVEAAA
jgi:hypothetical protein